MIVHDCSRLRMTAPLIEQQQQHVHICGAFILLNIEFDTNLRCKQYSAVNSSHPKKCGHFLYKKKTSCCVHGNEAHVSHISICNSQELFH